MKHQGFGFCGVHSVRDRIARFGLQFQRPELNASMVSLANWPDAEERCVGRNYLIEENVSDRRREAVETYALNSQDVREIAKDYFQDSIQGLVRGHSSSTFDENINHVALLSSTIEPVQKIIRLERIDRHLERGGGLDFESLSDALANLNSHRISALTDQFLNYPGERPAFAAFKSEVSIDLAQTDWLQRIIDRLGLYHHYPYTPGRPYSFALMEYTAAEVIAQANAKSVARCFALATVLECQNNPAFFPVPRESNHGFTVDLRERSPRMPSAREILHIRFDYEWHHVKRIDQWNGDALPDIELARERHLRNLWVDTGRGDFGVIQP